VIGAHRARDRAQALQGRRIACGISLKQVAQRIGEQAHVLKRWERGAVTPSSESVWRNWEAAIWREVD